MLFRKIKQLRFDLILVLGKKLVNFGIKIETKELLFFKEPRLRDIFHSNITPIRLVVFCLSCAQAPAEVKFIRGGCTDLKRIFAIPKLIA